MSETLENSNLSTIYTQSNKRSNIEIATHTHIYMSTNPHVPMSIIHTYALDAHDWRTCQIASCQGLRQNVSHSVCPNMPLTRQFVSDRLPAHAASKGPGKGVGALRGGTEGRTEGVYQGAGQGRAQCYG